MNYKVLSQDHQDETMVEFLESQERDHHSHTVNKQRYEHMLQNLPNGPFKDRIQHLLDETNSRLTEVEAIINSTVALGQMPDDARIAAAKTRLEAKNSK